MTRQLQVCLAWTLVLASATTASAVGPDFVAQRTTTMRAAGVEQWTQLTVQPDSVPAQRVFPGMVYDPRRNRLVVFGGCCTPEPRTGTPYYGDTWTLSLNDPPRWTRVSGPEPVPPPQDGAALVYDSRRDRVLFHGGSELWTLSLDDPMTWSQLVPPPGTPQAHYAVAAYDSATDRLVEFHGSDLHNGVRDPSSVHSLDLGSTTPVWRQLARSFPWPEQTWGFTGAFDQRRRQLIVFGGAGPPNAFNPDGWFKRTLALQLDANPMNWTELNSGSSPGPGGRYNTSAAIDPVGDRLLVFGGWVQDANGVTSDTWALPLFGAPWQELTGPDSRPSARQEMATVMATRDDIGFIMFGGVGQGLRSDVWKLNMPWVLSAPPAPPRPGPQLVASPNPTPGGMQFRVKWSDAGPWTVEVIDLSGRSVRRIGPGVLGGSRLVWDRRDETGKRCQPGLYFARLTVAGGESVTRLILL